MRREKTVRGGAGSQFPGEIGPDFLGVHKLPQTADKYRHGAPQYTASTTNKKTGCLQTLGAQKRYFEHRLQERKLAESSPLVDNYPEIGFLTLDTPNFCLHHGEGAVAMPKTHRLELLVLQGGERFSLVVNQRTGLPNVHAALYATTSLRTKHGSHATDQKRLAGVAALLDYLTHASIDFRARTRSGMFLSLAEQAAFVRLLYGEPPISPSALADKLESVIHFLSWWIPSLISQEFASLSDKRDRKAAGDAFLAELRAMMPKRGGQGAADARQGLTASQREAIEDMIDPSKPLRIWGSPFLASRNRLLLEWLLLRGHRISELLSLRLGDLHLAEMTYSIRRQHDSPSDPRASQPNVKGFRRTLDLPPSLSSTTRAYILGARAALPGAEANDFLFVTGDGAPLSRRAAAKILTEVREACPGLSPDFSAHTMRHTWNEHFSDCADAAGLSEADELAARMLVMGWRSEATARTYLRRRTRRIAAEVALAMQDKYMARRERRA